MPAMCDHTGREVGRGAGWPRWVLYAGGKANLAQLEAARYYDCANFARSIRAKALVSVNLIDTVCIPASVYSAFNALSSSKRMLVCPRQGHTVGSATPEGQEFISEELGLSRAAPR